MNGESIGAPAPWASATVSGASAGPSNRKLGRGFHAVRARCAGGAGHGAGRTG